MRHRHGKVELLIMEQWARRWFAADLHHIRHAPYRSRHVVPSAVLLAEVYASSAWEGRTANYGAMGPPLICRRSAPLSAIYWGPSPIKTINIWKSLPQDIVMVPSVNCLKGRFCIRFVTHCHAYPSCSIQEPPCCAIGRFISRRVRHVVPSTVLLAGVYESSAGEGRTANYGAMGPPLICRRSAPLSEIYWGPSPIKTINIWKSLPQDLVMAPSVNCLKGRFCIRFFQISVFFI